MTDSVINAYFVKAHFFTFPALGSGEHELVFASPQVPDERLSQEIVAAMAGKRLGKRLESKFTDSEFEQETKTEKYKWKFKGEYEDATKMSGNRVTATLRISDLGNLLTDAGKEIHYINGRLSYLEGSKIIPIYSSIGEINQ
jgi:hypothetical protein